MNKHYLNTLFSPNSVAVFGASNRIDSIGHIVFQNLLSSQFDGALFPINLKEAEIQGIKAYKTITEVLEPVELAVIATPPHTVPDIIESCGMHGVKAAIIITAGFSETGEAGAALEQKLLEIAKRYNIRLIGPNCLGIMRPSIGLNATFNKGSTNKGNIAFISQSGALCTAILDWAQTNDVGFSSVVSMGSSTDVDFGEILDYLVSDYETQSILLYIEGIRNARTFMSALRSAARIKPIILVKVGRHAAGSKAAMSHTASLVGSDDVFDAAVKRAGVVRVQSINQLFTAAKALSCGFHPTGNRLAIVTNGGGPGVMAADRAADLGLNIASLSEETIQYLNAHLPSNWSHSNPVDIIGDALDDRYHHSVKACLEDDNVDGVLVILTPQAMTKPLESALEVIQLSEKSRKPLLACWMGESQVAEARKTFAQAKKPFFRTPEPAVEVFAHLSDYYRNQRLLMQMPGPLSSHIEPNIENANIIINKALEEHRSILSEMESKALLAAFHIPIAKTMIARSKNEAVLIAEQLGFPIVMKVNSKDITHKSDIGGVILNIANAQEVLAAFQKINTTVHLQKPEAVIDGVAIEPMSVKPNGRELMIGVTTDPIFGPVITFGSGGVAVEVMNDRTITLPPLNHFLVKDLIENTHIAAMLGKFRDKPAINMAALEEVLLRVSEMVCELPALKEMDINPLIVDENGAIAVDARVIVSPREFSNQTYSHMAIHPYPTHLISHCILSDGTPMTIRPIRPEDAKLVQQFVRELSEESRYFRFMNSLHELTEAMLVRFTQIDYSKEVAIIASTEPENASDLGIARFTTNPDGESCEFAIVLADKMTGKGLGTKLMRSLIEIAKSKKLKRIEGEVLNSNHNMLKLMQGLGFKIQMGEEDINMVKVTLLL